MRRISTTTARALDLVRPATLLCSCLLSAGLLSACATNVDNIPFATSALGDAKAAAVKNGLAVAQPSARIALLVQQSGFGPAAIIAKGMKQAVELALFERNNPNIQLIVKDDRGTPEGAKAAAAEALNEGAEIILGPMSAASVAAVAGVSRPRNIPVLAFSNDVKVAGNSVFLMSFMAEQETQRIVAFAASQGKRRFAAFIPDTPYGRVVEPAFREAVSASGGTVVALERYVAEPNQMLEPSRRVFAAVKGNGGAQPGADALFLPGGQDVMVHVGPLLTYAGINSAQVKLIGTGSWDYASIGRDPTFLGAWYPAPETAALSEFSQRFAKTFGAAPPRLATLGYDAMNIAMALTAEPKGERYSAARLTRTGGFAGVDGVVRLTAAGVPDRSLAVHEVQSLATRIISPAVDPQAGAPTASSPTAIAPAAPSSWIHTMASSAGPASFTLPR